MQSMFKVKLLKKQNTCHTCRSMECGIKAIL